MNLKYAIRWTMPSRASAIRAHGAVHCRLGHGAHVLRCRWDRAPPWSAEVSSTLLKETATPHPYSVPALEAHNLPKTAVGEDENSRHYIPPSPADANLASILPLFIHANSQLTSFALDATDPGTYHPIYLDHLRTEGDFIIRRHSVRKGPRQTEAPDPP